MTDTLKAGRALDAEIAEKVMGGRVEHYAHTAMVEWPDRPDGVAPLPLYSTDIAAAWQVVEKMIADGWFPRVEFNNWGDESWHCDIMRRTDDDRQGHGYALSNAAPLSICRAALMAVESVNTLVALPHKAEGERP